MQSPKSKRGHAPGEKPASDNNPVTRIGGQTDHQGSALARSKAHVSKYSASGGFKGSVQSGSSTVPTSKALSPQGGSPGYVESKEAKKKGGCDSLFPRGSE